MAAIFRIGLFVAFKTRGCFMQILSFLNDMFKCTANWAKSKRATYFPYFALSSAHGKFGELSG